MTLNSGRGTWTVIEHRTVGWLEYRNQNDTKRGRVPGPQTRKKPAGKGGTWLPPMLTRAGLREKISEFLVIYMGLPKTGGFSTFANSLTLSQEGGHVKKNLGNPPYVPLFSANVIRVPG